MSDAEHNSCCSADEDEPDDSEVYYSTCLDEYDEVVTGAKKNDPEYFEFDVLTMADVERVFNESVEDVCQTLHIDPSLAKALLHTHSWKSDEIISRYNQNSSRLLIESRLLPQTQRESGQPHSPDAPKAGRMCPVCYSAASDSSTSRSPELCALSCGHAFCKPCWLSYFRMQLLQGISTGLECMQTDCHVLARDNFVLNIIRDSAALWEKYQRFSFMDYVNNHPQLRFCPCNCDHIIRAKERKPRRVTCVCKTQFCFNCGYGYHAPTACNVIKRWLTKCADDTETANYITANTKDCPKCNVCIEKNGGCNHMSCFKCKHEFCWMCLGDWKAHGGEYYECSRYKENPAIANDKCHQAREALKKYLFYFERWQTHANSLKLEEEEKRLITQKIGVLVNDKQGTWIDWQYLLDATELLKKCRYTLQYTYPYAYYLDSGIRKDLFEYQQAKLQVEVENLSWKIQNRVPHRGDLENQMDVAEKMRLTLLKDFAET